MLAETDNPPLVHLQLGEGGYAFVYLVREAATIGGVSAISPSRTATTYGGATPGMFAVKRVSRRGSEGEYAIHYHTNTDQALQVSSNRIGHAKMLLSMHHSHV